MEGENKNNRINIILSLPERTFKQMTKIAKINRRTLEAQIEVTLDKEIRLQTREKAEDEIRLIEGNRGRIEPTGIIYISINETFERIYSEYPKQIGKLKGKQKYIGYITDGIYIKGIGRTKANHQQIFMAIKEYSLECFGKEQQYIKNFDTFMNSHLFDYIDKTKEKYNRAMKNKYGNEYDEVKFKYV